EIGKGTTVRLHLPRAPAAAAASAAIEVAPAVETPAAATTQGNGGGRKILIVDDDDTVLDMTARMVRTLGYAAGPGLESGAGRGWMGRRACAAWRRSPTLQSCSATSP